MPPPCTPVAGGRSWMDAHHVHCQDVIGLHELRGLSVWVGGRALGCPAAKRSGLVGRLGGDHRDDFVVLRGIHEVVDQTWTASGTLCRARSVDCAWVMTTSALSSRFAIATLTTVVSVKPPS